ncbi:MAG TPA: PD-(D/E)XK nuclease family protein [Vicinamibacterales bacterium]|jgi:CRISPR/Cas system-associated exonuclease Cas4 (RecB family)|nr:PD-(D/E)XK nuclease family protein [Vicinamibacterales bacterium]
MSPAVLHSSGPDRSVDLIESSSAQLRLERAQAFVEVHAARGDVWLVGASRGAVDDLARALALRSGATMGLHRFSLTQLAATLAAPVLAAQGLAPLTYLGSEAVAARAAFDARREDALGYLEPVARMPGFPRALARTLQEIRLAQVEGDRLAALPLGGRDLAALLERAGAQFASAAATDRASLFDAATQAVVSPGSGLQVPALLLLDVPIDSQIEFEFVRALIGLGPAAEAARRPVLITVPFGDLATLARLGMLGLEPEVLEQKGDSDLVALRRYLFARSQPPERQPAGDVRFFSAPGEGRECVEIARRIVQEARGGVPFDEMAVFVRAPQRYVGLLEHALRRAGVPAWFDRGTRRPHPAGRAFLAILACACEKLSARRFAEYLSLAQVPRLDEQRREPEFVTPDEEELGLRSVEDGASYLQSPTSDLQPPSSDLQPPFSDLRPQTDEDAITEGTLRAPWKWETLIVESAVIGGDPQRWHRRLTGLANELRLQREAERKEDPDSARVARLDRDLRNLGHLRAFALPIVDRLAAWPASGTWGVWLDRFAELAPMVLRQPERVLRVIEQLRPMAAIGPISLEEARDVLADRLQTLEIDSPKTRYGRVFVGGPHQARGRTFRVVFVAGLAERMFPQRPHEDPMLLDREMREPLAAGLPVQEDRARTERLLLRLAVGAPSERLWLSYPRMEIAESRPRVPSFYALDVMRAITGRIPRPQDLQASAAAEGGAGLAWPAPARPDDAIDDLEHDLAVLRELLGVVPPAAVRGHAHYLLRLNEPLKRSVSARWARGRSQWTPYDGITRLTSTTRSMLESQRLGTRPYSLSALQKFAACPYQFLLSAIHRLERPRDIEPLQKLDPLTRGSIFHEVQAQFFRVLAREGRLPLAANDLPSAMSTLDEVVAAVSAKFEEDLVPAIDRVWRDEIGDIARDLHVWVRRLTAPDRAVTAHGGWTPTYFEFAFGLPHDQGRDPASVPDPVLVDGRFKLRGSVDLIESRSEGRDPGSSILRVTDHKTGRNRTTWKTVIGGGSILQPVLYSLAIEQALDAVVTSGRLFYCTSAGGFVEHEIPINEANRRLGLEALEIVDRAIELGFLPAAPAERACTWCDFLPVCGPNEPRRVANKVREKLGDLDALRERP